MPLIELENVNKSYRIGTRWLHVLKEIDLKINDGEFVSIMGSSGSGKSTLLNILGILDSHDNGSYRLAGESVGGLSQGKAAGLRNRQIGFVFQSFNLLPFKTAVENVALPLYYQRVPRRKRNQLAHEYLERLGLGGWADHLPTQLSGGQQQRVALARALVTTPQLILADEPTGALDTTTSYEIMEILQEVNSQGITVVVVTHEHDIAERTRRIIRLKDGAIETDVPGGGPPQSAAEAV